jgi:outer membrane protein TolC
MMQQAEHGADATTLDLMREGARAFVMLRMAQGELSINERQQRLVALVGESALARMRSGADTHHDVLQSQAELLSLQNQHTALEARQVEGRAMINALRNQPPDAPIVAGEAWAASAPILASHELEQAALARRPELGQMRAMQREQQAMGELMRREARPMFRVGAWYNDMLMMGDSAGFMVAASLPVFGVPRQRARAEGARRMSDAVQSEAVAMAAMIRAQVRSAHARYDAALRRERLLREVLIQKAQDALSQAETAYRSGMMAYASVVQDRRMLAEMQMELVTAEADRTLAMAELLRAVGAPTTNEVLQ